VTTVIITRLAAIFAVVAVGYGFGHTRLLRGEQALQALTNVAFYILTPALLFRLTATIDLADLPWQVILVYFGPTVGLLFAVYLWERRRRKEIAGPGIRAISVTFSNSVQLGIPVVVGIFGDEGLTVHVAIVSVHALTLLTILTVLVELDLARNGARDGDRPSVLSTALTTARRTVLHPVVAPVVVGLLWNLAGLPLPKPVDDILQTLGQGVVPVCLVLIGLSLAFYGVTGVGWPALYLSAAKLLLMPALVLAAGLAAGLRGTPLTVTVLFAALPIGSNALLFAQRYRTLEAETTAAIVASTLAFVVTGPAWILAVQHIR
jgi:malonate transporter and related proteins